MPCRTCDSLTSPAMPAAVDPQNRGGGVVTQKLCRVTEDLRSFAYHRETSTGGYR